MWLSQHARTGFDVAAVVAFFLMRFPAPNLLAHKRVRSQARPISKRAFAVFCPVRTLVLLLVLLLGIAAGIAPGVAAGIAVGRVVLNTFRFKRLNLNVFKHV